MDQIHLYSWSVVLLMVSDPKYDLAWGSNSQGCQGCRLIYFISVQIDIIGFRVDGVWCCRFKRDFLFPWLFHTKFDRKDSSSIVGLRLTSSRP